MINYKNCALEDLLTKLRNCRSMAIDIETNGLDCHADGARIKCISFSLSPRSASTLPTEGWPDSKWKEIHAVLKNVLEDPDIETFAHGMGFEWKWLKKLWGIETRGIAWDTQVAAFELDKLTSCGLKEKAWSVGMGGYERILDAPVQNMEGEKLFAYCAADADATHRLIPGQQEAMTPEQMRYYKEIALPLIPVFSDMHLRGVRVDLERLAQMEELGKELVGQLRTKFLGNKYVRRASKTLPWDGEFNPNAARHIRYLLYGVLGAEVRFKTAKAKEPAVHAEALQRIANEFPSIIGPLLDYRTTSKFYTTYIKGMRKHIASDGRIHGTVSQTTARSGRSSMEKPNMQNWSHMADMASKVPEKYRPVFTPRTMIIPDEGCYFREADYSQQELRVAAAVSKDRAMTQAYLEGRDLHDVTSEWMFPGQDVFSEMQRRRAKTINFGVLYLMSAYELGHRLGIPDREAQSYISGFFRKYSGYARWVTAVKDHIDKYGYVVTPSGRQRNFPPLEDLDEKDREAIYREGVNTPIQGTAYDLLAMALVRWVASAKAASMASYAWNSIHDSNLFNVRKDEEEQLVDTYQEIAENPPEWLGGFLGDIPLVIDWKVGQNWGEMEKA